MKRLPYAVAVVAVLAVSVTALSALSPPPPEEPSMDLGIFEPVAGRIVYWAGGPSFRVVDPSAPADHPTSVQLTSEAGMPLGWSSDGTRLLIMGAGAGNLFVLDADGSKRQVTGRPMPNGSAILSPDGSRVVFSAQNALYAVNADGGPTELLLLQTDDYGFERLAFSPDGTRIAYAEGAGDHSHSLWLMNADGSDTHQILANETTLGVGHVRGLAWSPAGDRIALGLEGLIYTFATDGSDFRRVITDGMQPYWSPDGSQIAYTISCVQFINGCGLAIADADGSNVRTFSSGASGPWHPATLENGAGE